MVVGTDFTTYDCIANEECAFDVKIKDTTICRCNDFVLAFLVIIALHYACNVTSSKKIEATIAFIQFLIVIFMTYVILRDVILRDVLWHLSTDFCICSINFYLMTLVHMLKSNFNP